MIEARYCPFNKPFLSKVNFASSDRAVYNRFGKLINANITSFFRHDLDWDKVPEYLVNKYENSNQVNMINYACSDGSEAYSMAISLLKTAGKDAKKFFPIKCYDIDESIVNQAKKGIIDINEYDKVILEEKLGGSEEFDKCFVRHTYIKDKYIVQDKLKNLVSFGLVDMVEHSANLPPNDSVVMARNVWPYIPNSKQWRFASNLTKLNQNSTLIIGQFDNAPKGSDSFIQLQHQIFEPVKNKLVKYGMKLALDSDGKDLKHVYEVNK